MKINSIQVSNLNFKSSIRNVKRNYFGDVVSSEDRGYWYSDGELLYSNCTNFFRHDLNRCNLMNSKTPKTWDEFMKVIKHQFKNVPCVHVYDIACSDGSETYSLMLKLIDFLGEKQAEKYFPIKAYDIDKTVLTTAKSGIIPCDYDDLDSLDSNLSKKANRNFSIDINTDSLQYPASFLINDSLKKNVSFVQKDFSSVIDEINPSNSLILCRNFLPYLDVDERNEALKKLVDRIDNTSVVVIGDFDSLRYSSLLYSLGLHEIEHLVYKKMS